MAKYIFITGGVVSSLGKGVTASSLGRLFKNRGLKVFMQKFDPYLNVDPGLMDPCEHGEVFVTDDGAETDLDLGHYERFIDERLSQNASITTGRVYSSVIKREREGGYNGATVQVIPHITDEIKAKLVAVGEESGADIIITEIGGTVGDIEGLPFLEAIRQARLDFGYKNTLYVHNTLVPYLKAVGEIKTKPTQHSVKELRGLGIQPDVIVLRTEVEIEDAVKAKISRFCNVEPQAVIEMRDVDVLYEVPLNLQKQGFDDIVLKHLRLEAPPADMTEWSDLVETVKNLDGEIKIGLVGDYALPDAYLSINKALLHAGYDFNKKVNVSFIDAASLNEETIKELSQLDGILMPYGEEDRATDGKLLAIQYARVNRIPFFGICDGMHLATLEYMKHVKGTSIENMTLPLPENAVNKNASWRVGLFDIKLTETSKIAKIYNQTEISERYRHKLMLNSNVQDQLQGENFMITGHSHDTKVIEAVEISDHPFFIGVQFQPQFLSRPGKPHPLFREFIKSAVGNC